MGKSRENRRNARLTSKPESVTPWWNDQGMFKPKQVSDRRAESEFFAEFSTESLFSDSRTGHDPQDPYEVLGLFPGASLTQVKKAHRAMAKRYHPDGFAQASDAEQQRAEQKMVLVNAAYAELIRRIAP